jgi:hypothetical protein
MASVRVLAHIKKLDDCFGQFLVRAICDCGACREIEPEALARLSWSVTLKQLALRMRCSQDPAVIDEFERRFNCRTPPGGSVDPGQQQACSSAGEIANLIAETATYRHL